MDEDGNCVEIQVNGLESGVVTLVITGHYKHGSCEKESVLWVFGATD